MRTRMLRQTARAAAHPSSRRMRLPTHPPWLTRRKTSSSSLDAALRSRLTCCDHAWRRRALRRASRRSSLPKFFGTRCRARWNKSPSASGQGTLARPSKSPPMTALEQVRYPRSFASRISPTSAGFALPLLAFITWPLRKFSAATLPALKSAAGPGFAAITSSQNFSMAPVSLT